MVSYISQKKSLKDRIIKAVETAGSVDKDKLISQLCLNTGFTEKVIKKIIQQLEVLDYIKVNGLVITKSDNAPKEEKED